MLNSDTAGLQILRSGDGARKSGVTPNDFTGQQHKDWGGNLYDVQTVRQSSFDQSINNGRTFISANLPLKSGGSANLTIGSQGGANMFLQRELHYGKQYPQFLHDTKQSTIFVGGGFGIK